MKSGSSLPYRVVAALAVVALLVVGSTHTLHNPFRRTIRARHRGAAQASMVQQAFSVETVDANDVDHGQVATVVVDRGDLTVPFVNKVRLVSRARRMAFTSPPIRRLKLPSPSDNASVLL